MTNLLRNWFDRYLSDEEAVIFAVLLVGCLIIILTMGSILAPLITGIVLAFVMQGVIKLMLSYRVPRLGAVLLTFVMFLGGFVTFLVLVIPRLWRQMKRLFEELPDMLDRSQALLVQLQATYPELISEQQLSGWSELLSIEASGLGQWVVSFSLSQLPVVVAVPIYMMLVPILVFFLLKDKDKIITWCVHFLPQERPLMRRITAEMTAQMANYIRGKFVEFLIVGIVTYVFFAVFGLEYAMLLAFLVGLSVIVPYLGVAVVTIPVVMIAYLQFGWSETLFYVLGGYAVIQTLDGLILVPLLFSDAVNLHPIAIIIAVLVFGSWWGLWGVFFAIPLATLIKAVITAWPIPLTISEPSISEPSIAEPSVPQPAGET